MTLTRRCGLSVVVVELDVEVLRVVVDVLRLVVVVLDDVEVLVVVWVVVFIQVLTVSCVVVWPGLAPLKITSVSSGYSLMYLPPA